VSRFVVSTAQESAAPALLRNYYASWDMAPEATICQAARATSAAPTFLPPVEINGIRYVDGALTYNNPIVKAREEANHLWRGQSMGCIVSIGTGLTSLRYIGPSPSSLVQFAVKKMTSSDETARAFETEIHQSNGGYEQKIYYRFNVIRGLEGTDIDEVAKAPKIRAVTMSYLNENWAKRDACVAALRGVGTFILNTS
jgi:predicted acylesterase/phospholipase RssA